MAIMSICSGMLVGIISSTIDRYSESTQIEQSKNEAVSFEKFYARYARAAYSIQEETSYGTSSFVADNNTYYLLYNSDEGRMTFFMSNGSGGTTNIISCDNIGSYQHYTTFADKDNQKNTITYVITMNNKFNDQYSDTIVLNNGAGINLTNEVYPSGTGVHCFAFRMVP